MRSEYLLNSDLARRLYSEVAAELPIIDYHNHLCVEDIASDREFENIITYQSEMW